MKAFADTFGSPAIMALGAFDPWLCVTAFRQLCPFVGIIMKCYNRKSEDEVKHYSALHIIWPACLLITERLQNLFLTAIIYENIDGRFDFRELTCFSN